MSYLGFPGQVPGNEMVPGKSSHPRNMALGEMSLVISIPLADEDAASPRGQVSIYCQTSRELQSLNLNPAFKLKKLSLGHSFCLWYIEPKYRGKSAFQIIL